MDDLLVIRIDKKNRFIKIFDGNVSTNISYYSDFEICNEEPDSDCEDFNDNARWIAETILKIMQLEDIDPDAHAGDDLVTVVPTKELMPFLLKIHELVDKVNELEERIKKCVK